MANDKDLIKYDPSLPNLKGWTKMSKAQQEMLQEKNSNLNKFMYAEGLAAANVAAELYEIKQLLISEEGITSFLKSKFKKSQRTGFRRIKTVELLLADGWTLPMVRAIGGHLYTHGIGVELGDLVGDIAKSIPTMRNVTEEAVINAVEKKIVPQIAAIRSARRTGKVVKLSEDAAIKMLFNTGRRLMRAAKNLHTSADNKTFLKTVVGWWMEDRGVPGSIECSRVSIPEGMVAKVGYPRGKKRAKKLISGLAFAAGSLGVGGYWLWKIIHAVSSMAAN